MKLGYSKHISMYVYILTEVKENNRDNSLAARYKTN